MYSDAVGWLSHLANTDARFVKPAFASGGGARGGSGGMGTQADSRVNRMVRKTVCFTIHGFQVCSIVERWDRSIFLNFGSGVGERCAPIQVRVLIEESRGIERAIQTVEQVVSIQQSKREQLQG